MNNRKIKIIMICVLFSIFLIALTTQNVFAYNVNWDIIENNANASLTRKCNIFCNGNCY